MKIIVVGAGMAGLSAARRLHDAGAAVCVIEAKERPGGRTWTDRDFADVPVELGAEFIHGDRTATWEIAQDLGLHLLRWEKAEDSLVQTEAGDWKTMSRARADDPDFDITRNWRLPAVPAMAGEDLQSYLVRIGFTRDQLRYVQRSFGNASGESMRFISAASVLEGLHRLRENGDGDHRIQEGYGTIVKHLAAGLELRCNRPVRRIAWGDDGVTLETIHGERFQADAAVLTVPVGVLQAGVIDFAPELPASKRTALAGLRMGPVIKMLYRFAEPIVDERYMAIYSRGNPPMWWSPSFGHANGGHVWTAFASGSSAMDLLALGETDALEAATRSLGEELGRELEPIDARLINWPDDPYTRGGYSFVLSGHEGARERLAEPLPPLYFAGEATEPEHRAATVHGAIESGRRAADEVLAQLYADRSDHREGDSGGHETERARDGTAASDPSLPHHHRRNGSRALS